MKLTKLAVLSCALTVATVSQAQLIVHTPGNATAAGVVVSGAFGPLAPGGAVGSSLIAFGVDYTFGNVEGIFNDPPLAFGGVSGGGSVDLLAGVDAQIVALNSLNAGLTDYVSVNAGNSDAGTLLLSVFDSSHTLISSVFNTSSGISTITIDRTGTFDIAYFSVTTPGSDTFGVDSVTIDTPVRANAFVPVPEPSTYGLMGGLLLGAAVYFRRRAQR